MGTFPAPPQTKVNRTPSATTIYRHQTPPKDVLKEIIQQPQSYNASQQNLFGHQDDSGFVVHRSKGITTLSSMQDPLMPARLRQAKEKTNSDSKADERGEWHHWAHSQEHLFVFLAGTNTCLCSLNCKTVFCVF